jgi:hypothetical protein
MKPMTIRTPGASFRFTKRSCSKRDRDSRERRRAEALNESVEQQQLRADDQEEERAENEDDETDEQGQFHSAPIGDRAGGRLGE